ncbi:uncharacterized protein LOC115883741 [Sitophilus oryzae]|uniref:Uncharacterized protein LOC115883741 n=1 Tax=Sitophilus oryzae TaxID=7048 RepID=A0A6J2Y3Z9_SITOR|nr:uncharacterized protein LOC115883741 [Sitophilus oryzae]
MDNWEKEQEKLRLLWETVDVVDGPDDEEEELASEEDVLETRSIDSDSEQDADENCEEENGPPAKIFRTPCFVGKDGTTWPLFGLLYLAGTLKSSRLNTKEIWDKKGTGVERFWVTISEQRFRFLLNCLRFEDLSTRNERKELDKLAPIGETFDCFVQNCKNAYCIGANATIDEKLEAFRGRCGFKQYIPSKPNKYGIKIFALVDASTTYCTNLEVYVGQQPEGPYKVKNDAFSIVSRLVEPISGLNRNLTCDNWFTSIALINSLLQEHKITFVGTLKKNKRELPPEFVNTRNRPECTSVFGFQENITIVSYVPKKNKNVILASSLHHDDSIDKSTAAKFKPEIITYYNQTKGGVDNFDKLSATFDVARNTRR